MFERMIPRFAVLAPWLVVAAVAACTADRGRQQLRDPAALRDSARSVVAVAPGEVADADSLSSTVPVVEFTEAGGPAVIPVLGRPADTAVAEMAHLGRTFEPDPTNHRLYNGLYQRVYKRMYAALRPLYEEIRSITGYPPSD